MFYELRHSVGLHCWPGCYIFSSSLLSVPPLPLTQAPGSTSLDATLNSLTVNQGILTPSFNPAVTNYTVTVPFSVSSFVLAATPNQPSANVSGVGTKTLSVGTNSFAVTVTAEDGLTTRSYSVVATREQNSTPTPTSMMFTCHPIQLLYQKQVIQLFKFQPT